MLMDPCEGEHCLPAGTAKRSMSVHLLCKEADSSVLLVKFKRLPKNGVEGLPGALVTPKWPNAEASHPCQPA